MSKKETKTELMNNLIDTCLVRFNNLCHSELLPIAFKKSVGELVDTLDKSTSEKIDREEIIKKLGEYHREQGVLFMSEEDAVNYFRGLVDLIESFISLTKE